MKKYLASLIPLLFCTVLSFIYGTRTPKDFPDPSYPYQTEGALAYLSTGWFCVGVVLSGIFISMFITSDVFYFGAKAIEKKIFDKHARLG